MTQDLFDLTDRVVVITGGAGLLGGQHARAIAEKNGVPVLVDIKTQELTQETKDIQKEFGVDSTFHCGSICDEQFRHTFRNRLIQGIGQSSARASPLSY
jgi:NAD(P)-dependent dehydrogenase (short-subunit alcohol dehydrogenase family)